MARKARHSKVFAGSIALSWNKLSFLGTIPFRGAKSMGSRISHALTPYTHKNEVHQVVSPAHNLFKRYSAAVAALFLVASIAPSNAFFSANSTSASEDLATYWDGTSIDSALMTDQDGYLTKINPQTSAGDRTTVNDYLTHSVAAGDTVSSIAVEYGLKSKTIMWANDLSNANALKINQKLLIPPTDGIYHHVSKGETLEKIAKTYSVKSEAISKQNSLIASAGVTAGDDIFIPGAAPIVTETPKAPAGIRAQIDRNTPARVAASSRVSSVTEGGAILKNSTDTATGDKPFIFPTRGKITQGFHAGHYAFDIGNRDRPAIWAAGGGTVAKVVSGCGDVSYRCGGGYGNHVIVDHGNGLQTLYAHMTYSTVEVGQQVGQGDVIGKMGRSGNVHGVTGIHLHFEVRQNGVKESPSKYYAK